MKILGVDDSEVNLMMLAEIVERSGHQAVTALSGVEALRKANAELPDLIILDVNMPGMSGYEVCAQLKADPKLKDIPVIMLTAQTSIEHRVHGLSIGADDYLAKPYSPRELMARIETRLRAKTESDRLRQMQVDIRNTFERFVPASVVEKLLEDPSLVKLGGTLQTVTVLFADLEGFTALSEVTPPDHLLHILNQYHEFIVQHIQAFDGTIDKFMGDAVMALYNTPLPQPDHALRAVCAALALRDDLPRLYEEFAPEERLKVNIGIHSGVAVVGNVGASHIMNYTAVGDAVNVASRLQHASSGGQITLSEAVHSAVSEAVNSEEIGNLQLKGRTEPVKAYRVVSAAGA